MPRALITGISGQTGSYLAEFLVDEGWDVHGITSGRAENCLPEAVTLHVADLRDTHEVSKLTLDLAPDAFVNLAAISSVAQSWKQPVLTAEINSQAVAGILASVEKVSNSSNTHIHFVQASSAEIFGATARNPLTEETRIAPTNPYGASKAAAHLLTGAYRAAGLKASSAILFNHESPRRPETFVTRKITSSVARISLGLQDKLILGDLSIRRDWGWAPDYARALMLMMQSDVADDYVISSDVSHSIEEFVEAAFAAVNIPDWSSKIEVNSEFIRPTDSPEIRGDSLKIREALGWSPTLDFNQIVAEMVRADIEILKA